LSSGEDILIEARRVRGQDVRMIHIPACVSDFDDIFDGNKACDCIGHSIKEREKFVSELEARTRQFQGTAQRSFLSCLVSDENADRKLAGYIAEYIEQAPLAQSRRVFARLRRRFAVVYAAMALAIDYGILPFSKGATLRDIRKCMNNAIDLLVENERGAA